MNLRKQVSHTPSNEQALPILRSLKNSAMMSDELLNINLVFRFESIADQYSKKIAVVSRGQEITFSQLNQAANRLAHAILGIRGEGFEPIPILLEHHLPSIIAIWGILKTGKAFVVLDPTLPVERLHLIIDDLKPKLLITNHLNEAKANESIGDTDPVSILNIEKLDPNLEGDNPNLVVSTNAIADIVYTSGTTGQPKGAIKTHLSIMHNTLAHLKDIQISSDDRMALTVFIGFDVSLFNIFGALTFGATLYMFDIRTEGIGELAHWIKAQNITIFFALPSTFRHLFDLYPDNFQIPSVRAVFLGGEPTSRFEVDLYRQHFVKSSVLITALGSTEAGRIARYATDHQTPISSYMIPAGFADAGKTITIVDAAGQPSKSGQIGEIRIKSRYLSPGYWNKPDLTEKAFISDSQDPQIRTYCTGDLGLFQPDGCLVHLGRKDLQVKIRGYRVEVTEIEATIHQHSAIRDTVVIARAHPRLPDEKQLVAYVVLKQKIHLNRHNLRSFLADKLPDYSIPSIYIFLEQFPYTSTGKVDRLALPSPEDIGMYEERILVAPRDSIENRLVNIWERVLHTHPIGVQDNYFELGGNSLLAAQLFAQIEKTFGKKLPLSLLFQASTIEQQADILRRESWSANWSSLVPLRTEGSQTPIFFAAPVGGNVLSYRDLLIRMPTNQPCYGLQAVGLDGIQAPMRNMIDVAAHYIQEIRKIQPKGPYYLAGSSFGGLAVYEMAQQLHDQGEEVALVVMFDAYGPNYPQRLPGTTRIQRRLLKILDRVSTHLGNLVHLNWKGRIVYLFTKFNKVSHQTIRRLKNKFNRMIHPLPEELKQVRNAQFEAANIKKRYTREQRRFGGRLVLFRASNQPSHIYPDLKLGWGTVVGDNIEVYEIPGHHTSIIYEPRVRKLAIILNQILQETQSSSKENS